MTERKCACNKLFSILVRGPNTEADEKSAYNNVQVGVGRRNIFAKISFLSHSLCSYQLHMYGAYLINEYHQDFKSIANFKVLKRMINVMMCYCVLFLEPRIS